MKKLYGNYLGLCINNDDPNKRGRVQIFIPHIMPALYENWNDAGEDIQMLCLGDNLPDSIPAPIVEKLIKVLPWAESASPILGTSSPGNLISNAINTVGAAVNNFFNQSPKPDAATAVSLGGYTPGVAGIGNESALLNAALSYAGGGSLGDRVRSRLTTPGARGGGACGRGTIAVVGALTNNRAFQQGSAGGNAYQYSGNNRAPSDKFAQSGIYQPRQPASSSYLNDPSQWRVGDVIASGGGSNGHIQVFTGKQWVSDFQQGNKILTNGYNNFTLHRLNSQGEAAVNGRAGLFGGFVGGPGQPAPAAPPNNIEKSSTSGQVAAPTPHQDDNSLELDLNKNNYGNIAKPEVSLEAPVSLSLSPENSEASSSQPTGGGGLGGLIDKNEVTPSGSAQTRKVSVYGSVFNDFTTYLDVKPDQRPPEATAYWQSQGYNIPKQEAGLASRLRGWKPSLNIQDTGKGAFLTGQGKGNLTPGFSVAIPSNNAYGLKPGGFLYITNKAGQPIGPNGGYFQVADKGNSQNLTKLNALDFYSGNDPALKDYFKSLGSEGLNVQPVDITGQSAQKLNEALSQQTNAALEGTTFTDTTGLAGAAGELPSQQGGSMVNNTDKHGAMAVLNLNNMAKGVFTYPAAGALLWVFFREGNPLFPVYFAASYGEREWASAFRLGSEGAAYSPAPTPEKPSTSTGGVMNLNGVGGMRWEDTNVPDDPTLDQKSLTLFGYDGSNMHFNEGYHQIFSKFDRRDSVEGDRWETTLGFKEEWVQGDSNEVTMGDVFVKIGNVSPPAVDAVTRIQQIIKECMEPVTQSAGGGGSSAGATNNASGGSGFSKAAANMNQVKQKPITSTPAETVRAPVGSPPSRTGGQTDSPSQIIKRIRASEAGRTTGASAAGQQQLDAARAAGFAR